MGREVSEQEYEALEQILQPLVKEYVEKGCDLDSIALSIREIIESEVRLRKE